jgi:3-hydroxyisobutyrate dehydrogenase-like beta-hydroxyacid dehydrogenase
MTITVMTRYKVSNAEIMTKTATEAKKLVEKHGAEFADMSHIHTGAFAGEWLFVARYADWVVFGKAQEGLANDPAWAKMLKLAATVSELTGRNITDSVDL